MSIKGVVDEAVVVGNSIDPVDASKEFIVKTFEVTPGFPWWILGLLAAGFVLVVVVGKGQMS